MATIVATPEAGMQEQLENHNVKNTSQKRSRENDLAEATEKKWSGWPGENIFRLVVPFNKVGGIIGRKGEFVKKMCEETKARIKVLEGVPGTSERIVMISAKEDPEAEISPAMDGLFKVHQRTLDGMHVDSLAASASPISSRLLVAAAQAGSLIGKQGSTIRSIQDASSATLRILPVEELPLCALADDRMLEIQGESRNVHKAVELVAAHLRKFLVDRSVLPLFEATRVATNQSQGQQNQNVSDLPWTGPSGTTYPNTGLGLGNSSQYTSTLSRDSYYPPTERRLLDSQSNHHGVSMYGRDPSIGGLKISAVAPPAPVITQVTQHMQVPLSYADAIIGTAGANISYMRRTSGATITIQETLNVPGEMTVEIHGSATQVQTAQQLVQNFMAGSSGATTGSSYTQDPGFTSYGNQSSLYSSTINTGLASGGYGSHYSSSYAY